jgi:hypothetical protein
MAKTTAKTTTTKPATKSAGKAKPKAATTDLLETASDEALKKLQELGIDQQLQADLEWCLGSYRYDKNPAGLFETAGRALTVLNGEKGKKTKGVTVKLIGDLEKALKTQ